MKKYTNAMFGLFLVTMAVFASAQATRTITVTGTVQDSATGQPVAGAMVLLFDTSVITLDLLNNIGNLKFDSTVSGADGKISCIMNAMAGAGFLAYGVLKQGYKLMYSASPINPLSTIVDLGVIKIVKSEAGALDTLTVSGKVVDSVTGSAIGSALVVMSGLGAFDTASSNRVLTNTDGTFSKQVVISKMNNQSIVGYVATQVGYAPKIGQKAATGKTVDLGTIALRRNSQGVLPGIGLSFSKSRPDAMCVYSLNGKLLYDGPVIALEKTALYRSGAVMVTMKRNKMVVGSRKVFLTR